MIQSDKSHLSHIVLQQLQNKQGVASVANGGVRGDDVGPGVAVGVQDESLPLDSPLIVAALSEALQSHHGSVPDSHGFVDNTAPSSANLREDRRKIKTLAIFPSLAALHNI